jgi:hypothetical protein
VLTDPETGGTIGLYAADAGCYDFARRDFTCAA